MDITMEFYYAVIENDVSKLKNLMSKQENVCTEIRPYDESLLYHAATSGSVEIAKILLENGCDPNVKNSNGYTPLHAASLYSFDKVVKALLDYHAKVDEEDNFGNTPLMEAVFNFKNNMTGIKLLIDHGANPNHKNRSNISPLGLAVNSKKSEIVDFLVLKGFRENE
jgi:ankyrin repeat protein